MTDRLVSAEEQTSYNHVFRHEAELPTRSRLLNGALFGLQAAPRLAVLYFDDRPEVS
jgi:hypothetical protein